ncbi:DNA helicase/exodeoxyribonuclease V, alpha subunit [Marinospirillum celere]|uniref:RecBCD enzyme subunit RecD n=1 Tax=Marinospirillum celere TaxID=1122252 RepID=A0A1I1EJG6_9GAMM|nr:exodeoxyribonuclease V subunit alpha [Marinospirillum celere]SFB86836.1 DNA helicase/exodeoxyribonuclease V, alpha subunit [Marinospirillum celere]
MNALVTRLEDWVEKGALRPLDLALTRFIHEQEPQASEALLLATALLSEANGHGHVCLDLQQVLAKPEKLLSPADEPEEASQTSSIGGQLKEQLKGWTLESWVQALLDSDAVADERATDQPQAASSPLVLAGSKERPLLYLRRYWMYERQIEQGITQRLALQTPWSTEKLRSLLDQLFSDKKQTPDWQKIACALAARSGFAIITGGPGTGKTTTVVRLLALLQGLQLQAGKPPLSLRLAAPTGKAAARLSESLAGSVQRLDLGADLARIQEQIPTEVSTLHRLLGSQARTRHFRHHAGNPLAADLVVVDEASMVDVEMLAKLLDALAPTTRLILLGDKDQLASVEAGSVLGNLCLEADQGNYTPATAGWLEEATGEQLPPTLLSETGSALAQATTLLQHSYRFNDYPGIGALAVSVNSGKASVGELKGIFNSYERKAKEAATKHNNLQLIKLDTSRQQQSDSKQADPWAALKSLVRDGYKGFLETLINKRPTGTASREELDAWALSIFSEHKKFQLLTAVRRGPWGVDALNQLTLSALKEVEKLKPLLGNGNSPWYSGRPVLVTRNDYSLKLMNGDIGICLEWPTQDETGRKVLRVAFPDGQGGVRWVLPSRLQGVETVFAMTVHKSQGSEFTHTALVLPDRHNPVLTKELLYTGITRSSQAFTLVYSDEGTLETTLKGRVERASGLG